MSCFDLNESEISLNLGKMMKDYSDRMKVKTRSIKGHLETTWVDIFNNTG